MERINIKIPKGALLHENIVKFVTTEIAIIVGSFSSEKRDESKMKLNSLSTVVLENIEEGRLKAKLYLLFVDAFIRYGQYYVDSKTIINVINNLKNIELKNSMSCYFPYEYKFNLGFSHFVKFNIGLNPRGENFLSQEDFDDLLTAKYCFTSIYTQHIEKKNPISHLEFRNVMLFLALVLSQFSRWPESLSYIKSISEQERGIDPQTRYSRAIILNDIKEKTCLSYNGLLLLKIMDDCNIAIGFESRQDVRLKPIRDKVIHDIKKHKVDIAVVREHGSKDKLKNNRFSKTEKFFMDKDLFLNEHSFFCNCSGIIRDDLHISTSHSHTQTQWVKEKSVVLDDIISSFTLSRIEFYKSQKNVSLKGSSIRSLHRTPKSIRHMKYSLLKSSFRRCYSILDNIGIAILNHAGKEYDKLKGKYGEKVDVYFFNMWDYGLFTENDFRKNQFLHALYSIAKDLDRTEKSALRQYKKIRNSIEHNVLLIGDYEKEVNKSGLHILPVDKMNTITEVLLRLTRSAIFSYVYYLRFESRSI